MMLLEMAAGAFGERPALRCGDASLSFSELFAAAGSAAEHVQAAGAAQLALLDTSGPAVAIGLFASACAGVPFVPLNYRLTTDEIEGLAARLTPSLLVTEPGRATDLGHLPDTEVVASDVFYARHREAQAAPSAWGMDPDAVAILLFTSGTTGAPKAAVLRHRHLVSYILGSVEFGIAEEDEAALVSVPPYHVAGMAAVLSNVYAGRRVVLLPQFDPEAWLETARRERVTHAFVVPTMLARIVDALGDRPDAGLPSLRALSYGGGKMPLTVIERAVRLFPETALTNAYGLTETSSTITVLGPEDHRAADASADPEVRRRLTSVGRPLPGVEIEVRGPGGESLGPGERGEIHVRAEQVSGEYLGHGPHLDPEGWFPTRDGGYFDAEGYLFVEGRIDDVIVRGGENLSPGEIEEVLSDHPAVADCAVVGVPDEEWGEAVAAAVVLEPGATADEDELREWVRARLRSSRAPSLIRFYTALPYSETGKLLRRVVRSDLAAEARS